MPNEGTEFDELSSRALFEIINGFVKMTHLGKFYLDHVVGRLLHIELFIEITIEKDIGDI